MRLIVRIILFLGLLSSLATADDKKDLYDKGIAAVNAGDIFAASDAFCGLPRDYKDAGPQCQTYMPLREKTLFRYKINYSEGMAALQNGDYYTAEAKFRNVKHGEFAESAKEKLASISALKERYQTTHAKRLPNRQSILFGQAEIFLSMSQEEIARVLSVAARRLTFAKDATWTVVLDKDNSTEGQIKFDNGQAIYVARTTPVKTPEELALGLADVIGIAGEDGCNLQNRTGLESGSRFSKLTMFCGNYVVSVMTGHDLATSAATTTELTVQLGSTDPRQLRAAAVLGTVFDQKGAPMPGVVVLLESKDSGFIKTATTGVDGSYAITGVPPGEGYKITASKADGTQIGEPRERVTVAAGIEREIVPPLREPSSVAVHFPK